MPHLGGTALVLLAGGLVVAGCVGSAQNGGDPGGRIMEQLIPVVHEVPGFEGRRIPWIAQLPVRRAGPARFALKSEPRQDSCDGRTGTSGWDPVRIQVEFKSEDSEAKIAASLDSRLSALGWSRGGPVAWADGGVAVWINRNAQQELALEEPLDENRWKILIEAPPHGRIASGC